MPDEPTSMSSYLAYLPAIMQQSTVEDEAPFLGRFLLAFERILTGLPVLDSGEVSITLEGHQGPVLSTAFNHDGTQVVTASGDRTARVWDVESGHALITLEGHQSLVWSVAFNHDGTQVVTASGDRTARIWDVQSGNTVITLQGHQSLVLSAAFNHDGTQVVTASGDRTARIWDVQSGNTVTTLQGHGHGIWSAAFNHDGTQIVTGSRDRTARIWDVQSGNTITTLEGHQDEVCSAAFNHDGTRIVTAARDKTAVIWDVESGDAITTLEGHQDGVWSAAFNHDGTQVVTASQDRTAIIWDVESGDAITILKGHQDGVWSAAFNQDGTRVVTASQDRTAIVWDVESGNSIAKLSLEEKIARLDTFFDARETPEAFLSWLAGWVALGLREEWPVDKQRELIAEAVVRYRERGTRAGLLHLLRNYTDLLEVDVQELIHTMQVGVVSSVGVDTVLGSGPLHYFLVHVTMPAGDASDFRCGDWDFRCRERLARAIIDQWKPAHTYYDLVIHYPPTMQVEVRSTVGEDTFLSSLPS